MSARPTDPDAGRSDAAVPEESVEELYEDAPCGYLSTRPDGTIVRVNRTFETWTGLQRDDLLGAVRFQDLLSPGGRIYHETHYRPLLQMQGFVREIALDIVCADDRRLPVLVNSTVRRDAAGHASLVRVMVFNATDRRAYERELVRARKTAERLHEREREVTLALQRAMLSGDLPDDRRCPIGTHYSPAVETLEVGGDWYDALCVAPDRIVLAVGDVVGKGLEAAATMGQLRSALRALAVAGLRPSAVLANLNLLIDHTAGARGSTVALADVDLRDGTMRLACAGHPPPIVLTPGSPPELVWDGRSGPLGTGPPVETRNETGLQLSPGTRVLFYSDGVVERRDRPIDSGIERLMDAFARRRDEPPDTVAASLSTELLPEQHGADDVCMLAFAFEQPVPPVR